MDAKYPLHLLVRSSSELVVGRLDRLQSKTRRSDVNYNS